MKILHCINSLGRGGAEKTLVRLLNGSSSEHAIVTFLPNLVLKKELTKTILIISIFPFKWKKLKEIYYLKNSFNPDLIQGWMYHGDLLASFLGFIWQKKVYWNIRHGTMSLKYTSKKTFD